MAPNNKPKVKELWVAFPFRFPGGMWGGAGKEAPALQESDVYLTLSPYDEETFR